jgi:Flp pilus assembly pilin Flp
MNARTPRRTGVVRLVTRLVTNLATRNDGQDLVEYALLTGIVSVVALAGIPTASALGNLYESWIDGVYALWETPPPSGG